MKSLGCIEDGEISEQSQDHKTPMSSNSNATSPRPPNLASTQVNISSSSSSSGLGGFGGAKQFKRNNSDYHPPPPLLNNAYANDGSNMGGGGAIPFPVDHQNHNNYSIMNPSVGGGGYYGSYNSNSPRDRVPVYGGYRDPRGKGDMRRGEMEQWPQNMPYRSDPYGNGPINAPNLSRALSSDSAWGPYGYSVHRSNPNPPPPPSGPPITAVYSQIGQNRPQKSTVPTRNMDYYGPASGAIPPPLPPVGLTTVIKDNTSPRSNNQVGNAPPINSISTFVSDPNLASKFVPPLPVKPSPPVRPPPPTTNDNTNRSGVSSPLKRNAKSADDLSPARSNTLLPSSTLATSNKDAFGGLQKPESLFNSAIKAKDAASGLRSPGPFDGSKALPSSSLPTQHSLSMHPPPPPPIAITHVNAAVTTHPANSSSSSIGSSSAASLKASDHKQSKPPSLAVPGSLSISGPITITASKGSGQTSNSSTAARSNSISSEKDKDVVEKPAATPRSGGPLIRVITGALSQDEASSSKVFDKVAPSPHTLALGPSTSSSSSNSSLTKRLGLVLNNPTPTQMFQSVSADAQKVSSAKPVISVNEINNLYRPTDKIAAISSNASALNLLPTSATPLARSVSAPIVTLNATQGEEDGSKTVRRPRAEWGKGLVKRQISNPEKEQPNPMPAVPETVEVRAAEELSEAPAVTNDITVTPPVVKQEEGKDAESVKEKDTKIAKEKPNLEVKVVENNEKGTLIKTEDQKPDKNGVKPETAVANTTASTANTAKLPATASATKRLLPPIHTSLIKKTSAIDKAAITKDIAAIINGSSSVAATTNATATATTTAYAIPTTTTAATAASTTTANSDTNSNSNSSSYTANNMSTNQSSAVESTAIIESSVDKPEAEEPAEKEEKPVEEGPAKKRKRRSKLQIRLDQEKQEQIQREKELLRLAEEEKMREIEREKDPQQFLDNLDHSISAATDTASIAIATANNNASNMANNSMRKRKPIAYAVDQAPRKRGRPFGIKSPRHISNQPPKADFPSDSAVDESAAERNLETDPDSVNADTDVKESDNNVKAVARGNDAITSPCSNPNPTIATLASTVKVRRGGRGRGGRGERNRALEAQAAAQLIYQALHNTSNNGPTSTLDHFNQAEGLSNTRRIREIYSYDPHKNTLARVFSREQDQIYARKAIQILLDFQSHAVESLNDMNAGYYHLIVENRSLFNTPLMPMPTSSDVCSAIDLLDTMIDAMYIQLKDFRAKQYSYEAILNDGKIATGNNGIDFPSSTFAQIFENNQWSISSAHLFSTMITQTPSSSSKYTTIQASSSSHPNPTATGMATVADMNNAVPSDSSKAAAVTVDSGAGDNVSKPVIGDPLAPAVHTASVSETVNEYMTGGKLSYSSFSELESYQPNIDRMKANRAIMTKVIRARKVGKRKAWEELGDRYLAVEQKWCAHVDDLERQEGIDQKEGPTLRTASNSMRAFTGAGDFGSETVGMRSARLSVVGGDSLGMRGATGNNHMNGPGIARSDYDQERLVHERFGNEFRELKIQAGLCDIPDMIQPWPYADSKRAPAPPVWPESVRKFKTEEVPHGRPAKQQDSKASQPPLPSKPQLQLQLPMDIKIGVQGGGGDGEHRITPTNNSEGRVELVGTPFTPQQKRYQMASRLLQEQQREREKEEAKAKEVAGDNQFPEYVHTHTEYLDLNSSLRLTMDGKRQQCSALPVHSLCQVHCNCALQVDKFSRLERCWTDMEKCIFVDKFLQFPKNFHKIAGFLKNRTTKDCIKFYYDAKSSIEFKFLLKEFDNRRKNARSHWQYALKCAHQTGAVLYPTVDNTEYRNAIIELPLDDASFTSFINQPPHTYRIFNFPFSTAFYKPEFGCDSSSGKVAHPFPRPLTILHAHLKSKAMGDSDDDDHNNSDAEHCGESDDDNNHQFRKSNSYSRSNSEDVVVNRSNVDIFSSKWSKHTGKQSYQLHQQSQSKKQGGGYETSNKLVLGQHYIFNHRFGNNDNFIPRVLRPSNVLYNTINEYFSYHSADHRHGSNQPQTNAKGSSSKKISNKGRARSSSYGAQNNAVAVVNLTAPAEAQGIVDEPKRPDLSPDEEDNEEGDPTLDAIHNIAQSSENNAFDSGDIYAAVGVSVTTTADPLDYSGTVNAAAAEIDKDFASFESEEVVMEEDSDSVNNADGNAEDSSAALVRNISIDSGDTNAAVADIETSAATVTVDSIDYEPDVLDRSGDNNAAIALSDPAAADSGIDNAAEDIASMHGGGDDGDDMDVVIDTPTAATDNVYAEETVFPAVADNSGTAARVVVDANSDYVSAYEAVVMVYSFKGDRAVAAQDELLCQVDSAVPETDDVATSAEESSHTYTTTSLSTENANIAIPTAMPIVEVDEQPPLPAIPESNDSDDQSLKDGAGSMPLIVSSEQPEKEEIEAAQEVECNSEP